MAENVGLGTVPALPAPVPDSVHAATGEPQPQPEPTAACAGATEPEPVPSQHTESLGVTEPEPEPSQHTESSASSQHPEPPPKVLVTVKGIDEELDAKKKPYINYTFGLSIGPDRVHTIKGRYSELAKTYNRDWKKVLPGCNAKFPGKHAGVTGSKDMKGGDNVNINMRSRELCEFFNTIMVDPDFQYGESSMRILYHELQISPENSCKLIAASRALSVYRRGLQEDLANGKKQGWLLKRGGFVKSWKRRWFVLEYPILKYYVNPADSTPKGQINCEETTLTEKHAQQEVAKEHCFAMYHPDRRTYFLKAEDEDDMMRWVAAIRHNDKKVSAIDFEEKALVGQGNFGKVLLVRHKQTDGLYAMKILSKESLRRQDVEHTKTERQVLQALARGVRHPFVVKLNFAFQTPGQSGKLYMVMDYVPGGDLYYHLRRKKSFAEEVVQLWAAELSDAIGFVHSIGIAFRDLKLENLLLDGAGHVHLADFGLSKQVDVTDEAAVEGFATARLKTFCGTPFYMAPELVQAQRRGGRRSPGYTKDVDWWAVGVIAFELLTGNPPFNAQSMQELYRKIGEHPIEGAGGVLEELEAKSQPSVAVGSPMSQLVRDFLNRDPAQRLGSGEDDREAVRRHAAFGWCDWELLLRKEGPVKYTPTISDPSDTSNFDPTFTRKKFRESEALPTAQDVESCDQGPFEAFTFVQDGAGQLNADPLDALDSDS